jgi:hypothetical protein
MDCDYRDGRWPVRFNIAGNTDSALLRKIVSLISGSISSPDDASVVGNVETVWNVPTLQFCRFL